jgi:hypothetical protein
MHPFGHYPFDAASQQEAEPMVDEVGGRAIIRTYRVSWSVAMLTAR